jgi:hypothetical protein
VTDRFGQLTVILTKPLSTVALFVEVTTALFDTVPQVAEVVGEEMWTDKEVPPPASETPLPPPQVRTPKAIAQVPPQPAEGLSKLQLRPALVGSVSDSFTPVAVPAPLFVTVIV